MRPIRPLGLTALLIAAACGGGGSTQGTTPVASVTLAPATLATLTVGGTATVAATTRDGDGTALTGRTIAWSTTAATVATVAGGVISAVAPGSATIRATSEGKSAEVAVTVVAAVVPVASVALSASTGTLVPQQTLTLTATARDGSGGTLPGRSITWSSSAGAIASVNNGVVTGAASGTTTITAMSEGKSATATITVLDGGLVGPAGGTVGNSSGLATLTFPGGAFAAQTAVTIASLASPPADPKLVPGTGYDFGPSGALAQPVTIAIRYDASTEAGRNPSQFRVHRWSGTGWELLAGGTVNTVTRTVSAPSTSFSIYAVIELTVPVATVTVTPGPSSLQAGSTLQLTATLRDAGNNILTGRAVAWETSNAAVASVSNTGLVTAQTAGGPITITARSENISGTTTVTVPVSFTLASVQPGFQHTCGLTVAGVAWCWGRSGDCQLGDDVCWFEEQEPVAVAGGFTFAQIASGEEHTCALRAGGAAYCWGDGFGGKIGDNATISRRTPTPVSGATMYTSISLGFTHTCARSTAGQAWCWGTNTESQLGDGSHTQRNVPTLVSGGMTFMQVVAGGYSTCALTVAGAAYCWGWNAEGQVGDGTTIERAVPTAVVGGHVFTMLSSSTSHTCGRTSAGELWCWGYNRSGELGDGTLVDRSTPVKVQGGDVFTSVVTTSETTCGLLASGVAKCWGFNEDGEVGDGTTIRRAAPVAVADNHVFVAIYGGLGYHTCGRESNNSVWCWGWNNEGQLGDYSWYTDSKVPVRVVAPGSQNMTTKQTVRRP